MAEDLMRYDLMAQEALRGVIRSALIKVQKTGLPGDHHFYVAFNTKAPNVRMSDRLRERYPEEMTIVLQHQFWGLEITETTFSLELSFDNIPEKITVPFIAVKGFFDPSVQFGLQFETAKTNENIELMEAEAQSEILAASASANAAQDSTPVPETAQPIDTPAPADNSNVVKLDAFRKD